MQIHSAAVNSLLFDNLGKRLYSADADGFIRVWSSDVRTQVIGCAVCMLQTYSCDIYVDRFPPSHLQS